MITCLRSWGVSSVPERCQCVTHEPQAARLQATVTEQGMSGRSSLEGVNDHHHAANEGEYCRRPE